MTSLRRTLVATVLALALSSVLGRPVLADPNASLPPSEPPIESDRNTALRAVYFPFLALGHGVVLAGKYMIGYPLYYTVKPLYDFFYESSEDPRDISPAPVEGS